MKTADKKKLAVGAAALLVGYAVYAIMTKDAVAAEDEAYLGDDGTGTTVVPSIRDTAQTQAWYQNALRKAQAGGTFTRPGATSIKRPGMSVGVVTPGDFWRGA